MARRRIGWGGGTLTFADNLSDNISVIGTTTTPLP
jgi:hypothetical protein